MEYTEFLETKRAVVEPTGFEVAADLINHKLFPFQRDIVRWALHLGKAAIFANVGLGKTGMQLEWAHWVAQHTEGRVLILAPLAVADQTVREGQKFGIEVKHVREQSDIDSTPIVVTNYDRVHKFDLSQFKGVVLDESSILKHYSKTFFELVERFKDTPYRLCCTATPAPNDWVELGNHAMFLGIMHFKDMLARWFVGEGDIARQARLKQHAEADFWRWLTSWAVCLSKPSDLGTQYDMPGYELPPLHAHEHRLNANQAMIDRAWAEGKLLPETAPSATKFMQVKRDSLSERVKRAVGIIASLPKDEPVIVWCDTDFEADALLDALKSFSFRHGGISMPVEVRGSQSPEDKETFLRSFSDNEAKIIITKPEIAGFGLNWQHCAHMIFAGVSFSFERTYQALGRVHRYGQTRPVHVHMIYAETEGDVMQILKEKQEAFKVMQAQMTAAIQEHGLFRDGATATVYASSHGTIPMILPEWLKGK